MFATVAPGTIDGHVACSAQVHALSHLFPPVGDRIVIPAPMLGNSPIKPHVHALHASLHSAAKSALAPIVK